MCGIIYCIKCVVSFILIPEMLTGLQNPYGYENSQYCTKK
jgi:hypothetical protein